MATLALRPVFPVRPRSASKQKSSERLGPRAHDRSWRIVGTAAATALALFSISMPMMGDPTTRLYALDATPTVPTSVQAEHAWSQDFELAPAMLGPAIDTDAITSINEDASVITMPELHVTATPIASEGDSSQE
jgi:hypothetical protein